jgi:hypothetical protein
VNAYAVAGDPLPVSRHRDQVLAGARRAAGELLVPGRGGGGPPAGWPASGAGVGRWPLRRW